MTERITHILVPLDFNPASDAALACAKDFADRYGARLSLLHVVTDPKATGFWTAELYVPALPETRERLLREARERLEKVLTAEERTRVSVTIEAKIGAVAEEIQNFARENHVDLIVMGTHGRRGLAHLFLGSVAEGVVRSAPCPVLTTRAQSGTPLQTRIGERDRKRSEHEEEHAPGQHLETSDAEEQR